VKSNEPPCLPGARLIEFSPSARTTQLVFKSAKLARLGEHRRALGGERFAE